jgi:hypothetical protein
MKNEKLQNWALIAEIVGGIAIVMSLIFVGLGVRQTVDETALNTQSIRASADQDLILQISEVNAILIENPELSRVRRVALDGGDLDSVTDIDLFNSYARLIVRHTDMAYYQYSSGLLDEDRFRSISAPLGAEIFSNKYGINVWNNMSRGFTADFVNYANSRR